MIYRFRSRDDADLVMTAPVAERVLQAIGKDATAQGIVDPQQLPGAIAALQSASSADDTARAGRPEADDRDDRADDDGAPGGDAVSFRRRVFPLLEMMKRAQAAGVPVTWHR
jgi:hypothetical protein